MDDRSRDPVRTMAAIILLTLMIANLIFYVAYFGQLSGSVLSPLDLVGGFAVMLFSAGFGGYVVAWRLRPAGTTRDTQPYSGD